MVTTSKNNLHPVTITIRGHHDSGKTTLASFIKMFLEENGYRRITVSDVEPLPYDQKDRFQERLERNRERQVIIRVEVEK